MQRRQYLTSLAAACGLATTGVSMVSAEETVATWEDPEGDDAGPGGYTYPTSDQVPEGVLDLASFSIDANGDRYEFRFTFHNGIQNNWDSDQGFSQQFIQLYLADPNADGGSSKSLEGPNVTFETSYNHVLVLAPFGERESALEDTEGGVVSSDLEITTENEDTIVASLPQSALGYLEDGHVVPLVMGWDNQGPGFARAVEAENAEWSFGGAENDNAPRVIDLVTPEGTSQSDALAYSGDSKATVPLLSVSGDDDGSDDGGSDDGGSDDGGSDDGGSDDGSSDDGGSDDGGSDDSDDDGGSDDGGSSDDGSSSGDDSSDDESDDGLPGFGIAAGVAGALGGSLAAKRAGEQEAE
jgi:carbohydrate-binding DOMON domain-containing protein